LTKKKYFIILSVEVNNMLNERYNHVESRKREGAHYTPIIFADFISENIIRHAKLRKSIKIVDPAVGDGELLISMIKALKSHSITDVEVYGFDTNPYSIEISKDRLRNEFNNIEPKLFNMDFLQVCLEKGGISKQENLFSKSEIPDFDLLIANPPYIRTQVLGSRQVQLLSRNFNLKGRIDIYQAFLVAMNAVLSPNGVAGVIVSNRFLTTKGASKFRQILYNQYSIKNIWDFGDTKVFKAAVLPAVMILSPFIKKRNTYVPFSSVYKATSFNHLQKTPKVVNQIEALKHTGLVSSPQGYYRVKHGHLSFDSNPSDIWRLQDSESEELLKEIVKNTWCLFKDIGKIRVGVKTTADSVFIRSDWNSEIGYEPELLKPLTTHHVAGRFRCNDVKKKAILYTHTSLCDKRKAYDINEYPLSKKYLEEHKEQLASRNYLIKANRQWYEIWVPQNPTLWDHPKIIFRDITKKPMFWMDKEGSVVNGDCYWMICEKKNAPEKILWLILAIANSSFIEEFYDIKFQNKLYSNRRRFMTQYVEQFPIPDPSLEKSKELIILAEKCYNENDFIKRLNIEGKINELVWSIFNVSYLTKSMD